MKITRTIKQERDCIQYTGDNIEEILVFINDHRANANEFTLQELTTDWKRPASIPLDRNSTNRSHDWRRGEEYQIYLSVKENGFCRLVGIRKDMWLVEDRDGYLDDYDDDAFKSMMEDGNWTEEE